MLDSVTLTDWLTIAAVLLAPLVAIQIERYLEIIKERRRRKLNVFHALMATRGARLAPSHIEALNRIDIEFYGIRIPIIGRYTSRIEKDVLEAWRVYLDHLCTPYQPSDLSRWADKGTDFFTTLLSKMATALDYQFDPVVLKKGVYSPLGHGEIEEDQQAIRKSLRNIFEGKQPLKVSVTPNDPFA